MILADLRDYLQSHRRASLIDMANRFDVDPDALRGMLEKWLAKGRVEKLPSSGECGTSCCKCDAAVTEVYAWVDRSGDTQQ